MTFRDHMVEKFRAGRAAGERFWRMEYAKTIAIVVILGLVLVVVQMCS